MKQGWLASSLRFLTAEESAEHGGIKMVPNTYRIATQWWWIMLDTFLASRTSCGLEAHTTPALQAQHLWRVGRCVYVFDRANSNRFGVSRLSDGWLQFVYAISSLALDIPPCSSGEILG